MLKIYTILLFIGIPIFSKAQEFTISGYIRDVESGEALIGANVYISGSAIGTSSNTYGFYSITLPADSVALTFSYIGFVSRVEKNISEQEYISGY